MAQITSLAPSATPGILRTFLAKTQAYSVWFDGVHPGYVTFTKDTAVRLFTKDNKLRIFKVD